MSKIIEQDKFLFLLSHQHDKDPFYNYQYSNLRESYIYQIWCWDDYLIDEDSWSAEIVWYDENPNRIKHIERIFDRYSSDYFPIIFNSVVRHWKKNYYVK